MLLPEWMKEPISSLHWVEQAQLSHGIQEGDKSPERRRVAAQCEQPTQTEIEKEAQAAIAQKRQEADKNAVGPIFW